MFKEVRCLITNNLIKESEWRWYSWELEAPISAPGLAELEHRRFDPDDELAKILWEEWNWTREIGYPDL